MTRLLPTLAASLLLSTPPDILPEGMKGITVEVRIEAGVLADDACVQYVVQKGDTLGAIAKSRFGDAARSQEITELNPGLEPNRLKIGQPLWLPPKNVPLAGKEMVFLFVDTRRPFGREAQPLVPGALLAQTPRSGPLIYIVPASARVPFEAAVNGTRGAFEQMITSQRVQVVEGPQPGRLVPRDDPTHKRCDVYCIARAPDSKLAMTLVSTAYDKDGKILGKPAESSGTIKLPEPHKELLLLLLALGGGAWVVLRARRRVGQPALA